MARPFRIGYTDLRILAVSGSLGARSTNTALLRAAAALAPPGVAVEVYGGLGALPHFDPDVEAGPSLPPEVRALRAAVGAADGLLFSVPEYAHGVPGTFKNALDWLVGGPEFVEKPVALWNASPRATHAQTSLRETVVTMSGRIVAPACLDVLLFGRGLDADAIAADPETASALVAALDAFAEALSDG